MLRKPKSITRSPPPSPKVEQRTKPREPYPIPSNNPASQYTLLEKLGTGSFGVVYKAMHNDTKQIVAIKQIGACTVPGYPEQGAIDLLITPPQTSRTQTTTSLKYNKRLPASHNVTLNT